MGWSGTTYFNEDKKLQCRSEFGPNYEILADAMVGSVYYAAVKHLSPERNGHVFCAVTLTKISRYDGRREFLTKGMDENCGPCEAKCPKRILDLLSPLNDENDPNGYGRAWRGRCEEGRAVSAKRLKLVNGMAVFLPEPVQFGDKVKRQAFVVTILPGRRKSRTAFRGADGTLCSMSPYLKDMLMTAEQFAVFEAKRKAAIEEASKNDVIEDFMDERLAA